METDNKINPLYTSMVDPTEEVCSLELAKRMKELGFSQHSLFEWNNWGHTSEDSTGHVEWHPSWGVAENSHRFLTTGQEVFDPHYIVRKDHEKYAAYTPGELGRMLPSKIKKKIPYWKSAELKEVEVEFELVMERDCNTTGYVLYYQFEDYHCGDSERYYIPTKPFDGADASEANARARLLISLKEQELI